MPRVTFEAHVAQKSAEEVYNHVLGLKMKEWWCLHVRGRGGRVQTRLVEVVPYCLHHSKDLC